MEGGEKLTFENPMDSINKNMLSSKQSSSNEMRNKLEYDIFVLSEGSYFDHVDWCDSNIKPFIKEDITKNWTQYVMQATSNSLYILIIEKIYLKNL